MFIIFANSISNLDQILIEQQNIVELLKSLNSKIPLYGPALMFKGTGNTVQSLPVAAGAKGKVTMFKDYDNGQVRFELDGAVPIGSSPSISGRNDTFQEWTGVDFDNLSFVGTSNQSNYYIIYNVV